MKHVDEFKLEMLVLDGPLDINERHAIEQHLAGCAHCRAQQRQIAAFYEEVGRQIRDRHLPDVYFSYIPRDNDSKK